MNSPIAHSELRDVRNYSIRELRDICQKTASNPARDAMSGKIVRFFSMYATALFLRTSITANQITAVSVGVFFIGLGLLFVGTRVADSIGSLIVFLSVILDGADGEVARFRRSAGRLGSNYVEPVSHDIQYGISFLLLGTALALRYDMPIFLLLGGITSVTKLLYRLLEARFWQFYHAGITKDEIEEIKQSYESLPLYQRLASWVRRHIYSSTGFSILLIVFSVVGRLDIFLWMWAGGAAVFWVLLMSRQLWKLSHSRDI